MTVTTKNVVWFEDVGRHDLELVGGKGANLGELTRAGIPVPPGFIVTADAYFRFVDEAGLREVIAEATAALDHHDSTALNEAATTIKTAMIEAPIPGDMADAIARAYHDLGEGPVAVRSSATAEDLPEASFAGQQSTFLNVQGAEHVLTAVRACWASLFEARAIFYRAEGGYDHRTVGLAVPVQRMVQSEKSGVMFTVEPVTSNPDQVTIEAVWGLGEAIVSGEVSPDLVILDKRSLAVLEQRPARQARMLERAASPDGYEATNRWVEVPAGRMEAAKLEAAEIEELARLGLAIEAHYGSPQDIEWAYESGRFAITQARPITTMRQSTDDDEGEDEPAPVLLSGQPASPGVTCGTIRVIRSASEIDQVREGDVLVAEMTTPDFVPAMKRAVAIVTERGGRTCHAAIISRELGIPCVVGAAEATTTLANDVVVTVDGARGMVHEGRAEARLAWAERQRERYARAERVETRTKLYVNLAEPDLADIVAARHVDGVGLLRAEFIVAQIGRHPRLFIEEGRPGEYTAQLARGIETFCRAFGDRPVVYRLTDFKTNEYANLEGGDRYERAEENPMIGYRGASRFVREPDLFALEAEAIRDVRSRHENLCAMVPFVRTPEELRKVKALLEEAGLRREEGFKLWMMVEVPSNVLNLEAFLAVGIDGVSIGSNDLTQLVLGVDRDSEMLADTFDERNDAVMRAIELVVRTCREHGLTVGICGQAPSVFPELTEKLVRWGVTSVSVSPDMIDQTRQIIVDAERAAS